MDRAQLLRMAEPTFPRIRRPHAVAPRGPPTSHLPLHPQPSVPAAAPAAHRVLHVVARRTLPSAPRGGDVEVPPPRHTNGPRRVDSESHWEPVSIDDQPQGERALWDRSRAFRKNLKRRSRGIDGRHKEERAFPGRGNRRGTGPLGHLSQGQRQRQGTRLGKNPESGGMSSKGQDRDSGHGIQVESAENRTEARRARVAPDAMGGESTRRHEARHRERAAD